MCEQSLKDLFILTNRGRQSATGLSLSVNESLRIAEDVTTSSTSMPVLRLVMTQLIYKGPFTRASTFASACAFASNCNMFMRTLRQMQRMGSTPILCILTQCPH